MVQHRPKQKVLDRVKRTCSKLLHNAKSRQYDIAHICTVSSIEGARDLSMFVALSIL